MSDSQQPPLSTLQSDQQLSAEDTPQKAVVLGGKTGLLGTALVRWLEKAGYAVTAMGREDVDLFNSSDLSEYLEGIEPDFVFNTIAYTLVDQAEDEPEEAYKVNKTLPALLGRIALKQKFHLVHYSTDFVFDGRKDTPYELSDQPNPLCVYGKSKLAGENALLQMGLSNLTIIRTAWLFGHGKKNFVRTMLNLARERDSLNVVHDQIGSPTYVEDLAHYSVELAKHKPHGLYHVVNSGMASWCELASEAVSLAELACTINAITTDQYPTKARRPAYSALCTRRFTKVTSIIPRPWVQALRDYVFLEMANED